MTSFDTAAEECEFLTEMVKRAPMLEAIRDGPMSMRELDQRLSSSRSTIHRASQSLIDQGLIRKGEDGYALTSFGRIITEETREYSSRITTARRLDEFLNVVEPKGVDVPLEAFDTADVVQPGPRRAHDGVKRIIDLIEEATSVKLFTSIISPLYVDVALRSMKQGTDIEAIFDESVVDIILNEFVEEATEGLQTGNFDVYVGENVPFELFVYDSRVSLAAHDDNGLPRMFVESESPQAIEWAENLYDEHRLAARAFDADELLPMTEIGE